MSYYDPQTGLHHSSTPDVSIPDDLSIDQFIFANHTPYPDAPWLVDALLGRILTRKEAEERTLSLARAYREGWGLGVDDTVVLYSGNEVDYGVAIWATFKCGGIVSCANPNYMADELKFQLQLVNDHHPVKILVSHPDSVVAALAAVKSAGLPSSIVVLMFPTSPEASSEVKNASSGLKTIDDLVAAFQDRPFPASIKLAKGDARRKLAFLSFSSGTTGLPKAVVISHFCVIANVLQGVGHWPDSFFTPYDPVKKTGDVVLGSTPFYHIYGLVVVLHTSLFLHLPVVTLNKFTFPNFLGAIQRWKITSIFVVPPIVIGMIKNPLVAEYDLSSLRMGMVGAAPLAEETSIAFRKRFPDIVFGQGYGMTETATTITFFEPADPANIPGASAGKLIPNIRAKVVSPDGTLLPPGEVGELLTHSPSNALGYLGNDKATRETFDADGYVHTGDEVYIKDGWVYVTDRIKELIKCKGMQVAPAELEGLLLEHPDVQDVCVIGVFDERAGERPKAFVVLSPEAISRIQKGLSAEPEIADDIKAWVSVRKVDYKRLGGVEFIDFIPKTASGKLLRKELRILQAKREKSSSKI